MSAGNLESCSICGYRDNLLRCSRCKAVYYCSKEHQKKHWKKHKVDCEKFLEKSSKNSSSKTSEKTTTSPSAISVPSSTPPKTPTPSKTNTQALSPPGTPSSSTSKISDCESEFTPPPTPLPSEGSSEAEILATSIQNLCLSPTTLKFATQDTLKQTGKEKMPITSEIRTHPPYLHKTPSDDMVNVIIEDLNAYGLCVLDNFCGPQMGAAALQEVLNIYSQGVFQDGQLVAKSKKNDAQSIRSDKIMWVDGKEVYCKYIGQILNRIDSLVIRANKAPNNGKLGCYNINGRTKAMLAVYPGSGTHYVKHVDNPNNDGRCITAIYYLNVNWDVKKSGGLLRIFPECEESTVADIAPLFDRLLFFWSDRQNPHEVQPAYDTRYAITLWYFDATERALATKRFELDQRCKEMRTSRTPPTPEQIRSMHQLHDEYLLLEQQREKELQTRNYRQKKPSENTTQKGKQAPA